MLVRAFDDDPVAKCNRFAGTGAAGEGCTPSRLQLQDVTTCRTATSTRPMISAVRPCGGHPTGSAIPCRSCSSSFDGALPSEPARPRGPAPHVHGGEDCTRKSRTGISSPWAPRRNARARAWARLSCAPCSATSTKRASQHSSSPPRSATCPSTPASASKSSMCCHRRGGVRPCGKCGENPDFPTSRELLNDQPATLSRLRKAQAHSTTGTPTMGCSSDTTRRWPTMMPIRSWRRVEQSLSVRRLVGEDQRLRVGVVMDHVDGAERVRPVRPEGNGSVRPRQQDVLRACRTPP